MNDRTTMQQTTTSTITTSSDTTEPAVTSLDVLCLELARAALFPPRLHRTSLSSQHFPALLQLEQIREHYLQSTSVSSVFPRHVLVVRNMNTDTANSDDDYHDASTSISISSGIEWNGAPDLNITKDKAQVEAIPQKLYVQTTSHCDRYLTSQKQLAFLRKEQNQQYQPAGSQSDQEQHSLTTIVLCSDRILGSTTSSAGASDDSSAISQEDLPPKSRAAVTEVLAHQLAIIRHQQQQQLGKNEPDTTTDRRRWMKQEVAAARAAECYFHKSHSPKNHNNTSNYNNKSSPLLVTKGSGLPTGYSWMPASWQQHYLQSCLQSVTRQHLQQQDPQHNWDTATTQDETL